MRGLYPHIITVKEKVLDLPVWPNPLLLLLMLLLLLLLLWLLLLLLLAPPDPDSSLSPSASVVAGLLNICHHVPRKNTAEGIDEPNGAHE